MTNCSWCGKHIPSGSEIGWAFGIYHQICYEKATKPLQDYIDSISVMLGMKALEIKPKRRSR